MIPLSVPNLCGNEKKYVNDCLETGWISTAGKYVSDFETAFADRVGTPDACSTMNGTAALHLALICSGVQKDDLVIMPNITFVASANAISYAGAEPILIDIEPDSWQMDLDLLADFLANECKRTSDSTVIHKQTGKRVPAIMIVHVQGHMTDMYRLLDIANSWGLKLIEDAAEALGATYDGKQAGTFGDFGCFSFNGNKIISTGGGGMITSNSQSDITYVRHLATTAKTDPLKYFHDELGYNYRLVNILAAVGLGQLELLDEFVETKEKIAKYYENQLVGTGDITFQKSGRLVKPNNWLFTIKTHHMPELLKFLNENGVMARPFWEPMSNLPMYSHCIYHHRHDVCSEIHTQALSIPCSTNITQNNLDVVVQKIRDFYAK